MCKIFTATLKSIFSIGPCQTFLNIFALTNWKEGFFRKAWSYLFFNRIEGDYLEFGVYRGRSFCSAFKMSSQLPRFYNLFLPLHQKDWEPRDFSNMRFFAFDSFLGMPETACHENVHPEHRAGGLACCQKNFEKILRAQKVDRDRVKIVPGFFQDSLTSELKKNHALKNAAFIFIDCDIYESTKDVLQFCSDIIQSGTLLAFDDWFAYGGSPQQGEPKAFYEWLKAHPELTAVEFQNFGWHGKSFILYRQHE